MGKSKISQELRNNRRIMSLVVVLALFSAVMSILVFFDISPQEIGGSFEQKVTYINTSTVYLPEEIAFILNSRYESDTKEFVYCLHGRTYEDGYLVTKLVETTVIEAHEDTVQYESCKKTKDHIGTIHSHPQPDDPRLIATCELSKQDIFTFGAEKQALTAVVCGENEYGFYASNNFEESLQIALVEVASS